jgi:hypothetical protein
MKLELEEKLTALAPVFLRDMHGDETKTCMAFGIECSDGWFAIVKEMCEKIEAVNRRLNGEALVVADQIKEKFGELTVYYSIDGEVDSNVRDEVRSIVVEAEAKSWDVCEECGKPATCTTKGWIRRLCKECYDRRSKN